jgi:integrase
MRKGIFSTPINVKMPRVEQKKMRVLSPEELNQILKVCKKPREKALILFLVDSGMRRSEARSLNWIDVDIPSGVVNIRRSKSKKARSVFIGVKTRRALLRYRRTVSHEDNAPVFQTQSGTRFKHSGFRQVIRRISEKADIPFSAHDLRRTFATLSLRAGMNVLHLQSLLGHSSLEMTRRYVSMVREDLGESHKEHGPIDRFLM